MLVMNKKLTILGKLVPVWLRPWLLFAAAALGVLLISDAYKGDAPPSTTQPAEVEVLPQPVDRNR